MEIKELINLAVSMENKMKDLDSKSESDKVRTDLEKMSSDLKKFNGTLVKMSNGKIGRIWHSHWGTFKIFFGNRHSFKWSNNYAYLQSDFEIIEEDNSDLLESVSEIDNEISELQSRIYELTSKKNKMLKDFIVKVDPNSFEETTEVNRCVFSMDGSPVFINEAFCELTGIRVTS